MTWQDNLRNDILSLKDEIVSIRREFHKHPELGFDVHQTSKFICDYLQNLGLKTNVLAQTGVIATLEGKTKGKVIALRSDMDALPVQDLKECDYKSQREGVSHACGHDGHMAMILAMAKILSGNKDKLKGAIRFIFQPAEENQGGALPMIDEGCLENPSVEEIYGLHLWGMAETGTINTLAGPIMAATGEFELEIKGRGGHGAHPEDTIDAVVVASNFITFAQTIISRNVSSMDSGVVSFGTINGGSAFNVIASSVKLTGTIRARCDENLEFIKKRMEEVLNHVCLGHRAEYDLEFTAGYAALVNDKQLAEQVKSIAIDLVGEENFQERPSMGGEDFAYYAQKVPACFIFIGSGNNEKGIVHPNHHSLFDIDEESLLLGVELLLRILESRMSLSC